MRVCIQQNLLKIGRAKDKRKSEWADDDNGIRIEHRDSEGRLLTQKEAFRQVWREFWSFFV
jgi:hypothetical protein